MILIKLKKYKITSDITIPMLWVSQKHKEIKFHNNSHLEHKKVYSKIVVMVMIRVQDSTKIMYNLKI